MIVFVGDKPGKANLDPYIPFVGTKSYKTLLEWIYAMNVDINAVMVVNRSGVIPYPGNCDGDMILIKSPALETDLCKGDKVVALGNEAEQHLNRLGVKHFKLPHPSGLNRKLNDKKYVDQILKECKTYLKSEEI